MGLNKATVGCLVCLNSTNNNTLVSADKSQKIFSVCCSYVKDAINVEFLIENIRQNNNKQLSFCKNCLDSSLNLSQLVEELDQLKNKIAVLTDNFSKTIAQRRCKLRANNNKQVSLIENEEETFITQTAIGGKSSLVLDSLTSTNQSLEISDQIIVEKNPCEVEVIDVEAMKSETAERDDLFTNLFSNNEEENNCDIEDPLSENISVENNDLQLNIFPVNLEIVKNEDNTNYYSQYTNSNVHPLVLADGRMSNLAVESIVNDVQSTRYNFSQSAVQNQIGQNMTQLYPCSSSSAIPNRFISNIIAKGKGKKTSSKVNYTNFKTALNKLNSKRPEQNKTGERPLDTQVAKRYTCDQCSSVFSIRQSFIKHLKIVHGYISQGKPFLCRVGHCEGKSFREVKRRDVHEDFCRRHFRVKNDSSLQ